MQLGDPGFEFLLLLGDSRHDIPHVLAGCFEALDMLLRILAGLDDLPGYVLQFRYRVGLSSEVGGLIGLDCNPELGERFVSIGDLLLVLFHLLIELF